MLKTIFTLLFILPALITTSSIAQENTLQVPIGWRGSIELHTICDKSKESSCTFVVRNDSIRAIVLNNQAEVVQQFGLPHFPDETVLGGFIRNDSVFLFIENANEELHNWVLDIASGKATENILAFGSGKGKVLDRISCGDRFLYFMVDKKSSQFIIYNFTAQDDYSKLQYTFGEGVWKDLTSGLFNRSINVEKIDLEGECSLDAAIQPNKLYVNRDTLFLVINKHKDSTNIFTFDLANKKVDSRLIIHRTPLFGELPVPSSENSFLLQNKLYYVRATFDSLNIQIVDIYTGNIIKSFSAGKDDDIAFKNTPITQDGSQMYALETRELEKTKQLLRKMVNGDAVIIATPNSKKQVEIAVASYTKISGGGGGGGMFIPGAGGGSVFIPTGGFSRSSSWVKSAHFKMLVNAGSCEHIEGQTGRSINEQIEYYSKELKIPPQAENLFQLNGHYYYAYYDKKERRVVMLGF
jgi:hypothetical protein